MLALTGAINFLLRVYMLGLLVFVMGVKIYGIFLEFKRGIKKFKAIGTNAIQ